MHGNTTRNRRRFATSLSHQRVYDVLPTHKGPDAARSNKAVKVVPRPERKHSMNVRQGLEGGSSFLAYPLPGYLSAGCRRTPLAAKGRLSESLHLYVGGGGGTGKSQVILAIQNLFRRRNESRRLRLTSYTGVAAHNINGMMLHAVLSLNQRSLKSGRGKSRQDLIAMWDSVDFSVVDEVSMIGFQFMLSLHQALTEAKSNPAPFGGVNIVFAGDFAQLPPVGQVRLFTKLNTKLSARSGTMRGQRNVLGKLLWLHVKKVVLLHRPMRQAGSENAHFVDLLGRLRVGTCSDEDYELLKSRIGRRAYQPPALCWNNVNHGR